MKVFQILNHFFNMARALVLDSEFVLDSILDNDLPTTIYRNDKGYDTYLWDK